MTANCPLSLTVLVLLLLVGSFVLQAIALTTSYWSYFSARLDLGKPEELGHFGLWNLCSLKAPKWTEDCDPLDTFFERPPFLVASKAIAMVHMLQVLLLIPLVSVRAIQIARFTSDIGIKSKILCIANVAVAFLAVIFSILVAIFASIGEKRAEYTVKKGWSFWTQIAVIVLDLVVALLCAGENFRFWQRHIRQHSDPWGHRSETYANSTFESGSPIAPRPSLRTELPSNGNPIAFTDASGQPWTTETSRPPLAFAGQKTEGNERTANATMLTYENPSYQENSPSLRRNDSCSPNAHLSNR